MTSLNLLKAINNIDDKYVLEAMPSQYKEEKKSIFNLRWITSLVCVLLVGVLGFNVVRNIMPRSDEAASSESTINPYSEDSDTLDFIFNTPDLEYNKESYVIGDEIIEVNYYDNEKNVITLRKAKSNEDISGDYSTYDILEDSSINGADVTIKQSDNQILITWLSGEYSYSLYSDSISEDKAIEIVTYILNNN